MSSNDPATLYWFWSAFFVLFGVFFITRGRRFLAASTADCCLKVPSPDAGTLERVEAAVERRQAAEGGAAPLGVWLGVFCIALGAVEAAVRVQPALLYALMCLGMAVGVAFVFLRLRNSQPTRVAVLSARTVDSVIPPYWFFVAGACAFGVLLFADGQHRGPAILVAVSSLITIALAWRLANLPALLSGVDIPAEQIVDDRLRFYRSRAAIVFAMAQTFVFCSNYGELDIAQTAALSFTFVAFFGFSIWMVVRQRAPVRLA